MKRRRKKISGGHQAAADTFETLYDTLSFCGGCENFTSMAFAAQFGLNSDGFLLPEDWDLGRFFSFFLWSTSEKVGRDFTDSSSLFSTVQ